MGARILLASDQQGLHQAIRAVLARHQGMKVIAEAQDTRTAVEMALALVPDVIVVDADVPGIDWAFLFGHLIGKLPDLGTVILAAQSNPNAVEQAFDAGAEAYVLKEAIATELVAAIRAVLAHRTYLSSAIAGIRIRHFWVAMSDTSQILSAREKEVLALLAQGKTTKQMAELLSVSTKTIETHRQHIMDKLGMRKVADLTRYAIREGLTGL